MRFCRFASKMHCRVRSNLSCSRFPCGRPSLIALLNWCQLSLGSQGCRIQACNVERATSWPCKFLLLREARGQSNGKSNSSTIRSAPLYQHRSSNVPRTTDTSFESGQYNFVCSVNDLDKILALCNRNFTATNPRAPSRTNRLLDTTNPEMSRFTAVVGLRQIAHEASP